MHLILIQHYKHLPSSTTHPFNTKVFIWMVVAIVYMYSILNISTGRIKPGETLTQINKYDD